MKWLKMKSWNPYVVGVLIGILSMFTFYTANKPLGVSTAFSRTAGMIEKFVAPEYVANNLYFQEKTPKIDWQWMLVVGILIGAFLSAKLSGDYEKVVVPRLWQERFGKSKTKRLIWSFLGGVILLFGARLAGGCTSGHGISGTLQLAISGWLFFVVLFISGIITAKLIYGGLRK